MRSGDSERWQEAQRRLERKRQWRERVENVVGFLIAAALLFCYVELLVSL